MGVNSHACDAIKLSTDYIVYVTSGKILSSSRRFLLIKNLRVGAVATVILRLIYLELF